MTNEEVKSETPRPLAALNGVETMLALERVRGEIWRELTRHDELLKSAVREVARTERFNDRALEIARTGLDAHLETLNGHTAEMREAQAKHAREMVEAQNKLQSKDSAERDMKEIDRRIVKIEDRAAGDRQNDRDDAQALYQKNEARILVLEKSNENLAGRLALPLGLISAGAAAIVAAVVGWIMTSKP